MYTCRGAPLPRQVHPDTCRGARLEQRRVASSLGRVADRYRTWWVCRPQSAPRAVRRAISELVRRGWDVCRRAWSLTMGGRDRDCGHDRLHPEQNTAGPRRGRRGILDAIRDASRSKNPALPASTATAVPAAEAPDHQVGQPVAHPGRGQNHPPGPLRHHDRTVRRAWRGAGTMLPDARRWSTQMALDRTGDAAHCAPRRSTLPHRSRRHARPVPTTS